jgi:hypothetical protein
MELKRTKVPQNPAKGWHFVDFLYIYLVVINFVSRNHYFQKNGILEIGTKLKICQNSKLRCLLEIMPLILPEFCIQIILDEVISQFQTKICQKYQIYLVHFTTLFTYFENDGAARRRRSASVSVFSKLSFITNWLQRYQTNYRHKVVSKRLFVKRPLT